MDEKDIWSETQLIARIQTFGFQMAEMGRQQAFENDARISGDWDGAYMYSQRVEMYREAADTLRKEISAQILTNRTNTPETHKTPVAA